MHNVAQVGNWGYTVDMITASEMGRRGAKKTNKLLTTEMRSKAAKKGWKKRRLTLKAKKK